MHAVTDVLSTWHIMLTSTFPMRTNARRMMLSCTRKHSVGSPWPPYAEQSAEKCEEFVTIWLPHSTVNSLSLFMRSAGKRSKNKSYTFLKQNLPHIARKLERLQTSSWNFRTFSGIIFGLHCQNEADNGYRDIMSTMSKIATKIAYRGYSMDRKALSMILYGLRSNKFHSEESMMMLATLPSMLKCFHESPDSQGIANALYGLQGMKSNNAQVLLLLSALTPIIMRCEELLSTQAVGNALYGLQGMSSDKEEVLLLLSALAPKVQNCEVPLSGQAVGNALYGLQRMSSNKEEVLLLLSALAPKVESCVESLTAQEVGNALYGLQCMQSNKEEVRQLLSALIPKIRHCSEALKAQEVGNALYGLRGMSSSEPVVLRLLTALIPKVHSCGKRLNAQEIGNALYGLRSMTSEKSEVLSLLTALLPKVRSCTEPLIARQVGNALYGMHGMSSDSNEVLLLLSALTERVQSCEEYLNAQEVGNALYGLQGMSSDKEEVLMLLSALTPKVQNCEVPLSGQAVGNALYGLQGMSGDKEEVLLLLSALAPKVESCVELLTAQEVGIALYGLQGLLHVDIGRDIALGVLQRFLAGSVLKASADDETICLAQSIGLVLPALREHLTERESEILSDLFKGMEELDMSALTYPPASLAQESQEKNMHALAVRAFESSNATVSQNNFLFGLFECDVVVHIQVAPNAHQEAHSLIFNFELDGEIHRRKLKGRFCSLRDKYLQSRGVTVARINASSLREMADNDALEWMQDTFNEAKRSRETQVL